MTILIFTEGTVLMHGSAKGKIREEVVQQSKKFRILIDPDGIHDYQSYIPVYNSL